MTFNNKPKDNNSISETEKKQIDAKLKEISAKLAEVETTANSTADTVESIVTGDGETIIPVTSGGTAANTSTEARNELLGDIPEIVSEIDDNTILVGAYPNADTTSGKIGKRGIVAIYEYIRRKFINDSMGTGSDIARSNTDETSIADTFDTMDADIASIHEDISTINTNIVNTKKLIPTGASEENKLVDGTELSTILTDYQRKLTAGNNVEITDNNTINVNLANVYKFCGSVPTYADLPTSGVRGGDVYNVEDTEMNYGWDDTRNMWDQLGANAVLADNSVTSNKIADGAVTLTKLATSSVSTSKIQAQAVETSKVSDGVLRCDIGTVCRTPADNAVKQVIINDLYIEAGMCLKILFTNANTAENPCVSIISVAGVPLTANIPIKSVRGGEKIVPVTHSGKWRGADTYTDEMWQAYTTLELMYDGTDWVIMGNPLFESYVASDGSKGYSVYSDGKIEQWVWSIYSNSQQNATFDVTFSDTNYCFIITCNDTTYSDKGRSFGYNVKTVTSDKLTYQANFANAGGESKNVSQQTKVYAEGV